MIISRYVKIKSFNQHQYCTILEIECKDEGRIYPKVGFLTILQAVANTVGQNSALILVLRPNISASVSGQLFCEKREGVQKMVFSWKPFLPMGSSRQRAKAWNALQPSLIVMMRHTQTHTQNIAYVGSKLKILYHKHCICMCNNITHNRITGRATIAN